MAGAPDKAQLGFFIAQVDVLSVMKRTETCDVIITLLREQEHDRGRDDEPCGERGPRVTDSRRVTAIPLSACCLRSTQRGPRAG